MLEAGNLGAVSQACESKQEAHGTSEITEMTVPTFSISSKKEFVLNGQINGVSVFFLVQQLLCYSRTSGTK